MYRQQTISSLSKGLGSDPAGNAIAYKSLLSAWNDYLEHDNLGRPFVLIGHSQGAAMLIKLVHNVIDKNSVLRSRLVLAILPGGNVTVRRGETRGGSFAHVPLCSRGERSGCVIAYSSFPVQPPVDALFSRPGQGVSLQSGQTARAGLEVACVNPAAIDGGTGLLQPFFLSEDVPGAFATEWVTYPGMYRASCEDAGGASWLEVVRTGEAADERVGVSEIDGPRMGYHPYDMNLALGNLVGDVAEAESAYLAQSR